MECVRFLRVTATSVAILLLAGCGGNNDVRVYDVRKSPADDAAPAAPAEDLSVAPAPAAAPTAAAAPGQMPPMGMQSMAGQTLPDSALNPSSTNPVWVLPSSWTEVAASSMRRASFSADGPGGVVDISVTSFPGDVGGLLANVNRWRGQIGLPPIGNTQLESHLARREIHGKEGIIARMVNGPQAMTVGILEHQGQSWFFRMAGPAATVAAHDAEFDQFMDTIQF